MSAIVTGGASGIGRATGLALAAHGYALALCDLDEAGLEESRRAVAARGGSCLVARCDVGDEAAVSAFAERVARELGPPRVLVNNAAVIVRKPLVSLTLADWDFTLRVNLRAVFLCTQLVGRHMLAAGGGSIVNVSSTTGSVTTEPGAAAYSASKAAVVSLTQTTAIEWGPLGVRCNSVSPGFVRTAATEAAYRSPEVLRRRAEAVPLGRVAQPADVADVVAFLVSDGARFVNGENVVIDGGLTANLFAQLPGRERMGEGGEGA